MSDVRTLFPRCEHRDEDGDLMWFETPSHDELIAALGWEVAASVTERDYQGKIFVLLRDGRRFGFLAVGFGSCSVCDALQACGTYDDLAELRDQLIRAVRWEESAAGMAAYLRAHDWDVQWYGSHREEKTEFLRLAGEVLGAPGLGSALPEEED
jgi:hypothetical protein